MSAEHVIPFPETCTRHDICIQESRIAVLEVAASEREKQMDRMESKLNAVLGIVFMVLVSILTALLRKA